MNTHTVAFVVSLGLLSLGLTADSAEHPRLQSDTALALERQLLSAPWALPHTFMQRLVSSFVARFTPHWPMALHDPVASGFNPAEKRLGMHNAHQLEVKWMFDADEVDHPVGPIHATPVVLGDTIYVE
jgi:hypothetical protein